MLNTFNKKLIWLTVFFVLFLGLFCLVLLNINNNKVVLGYSLANQNYQGMSFEQAQQTINNAVLKFEQEPLNITFKSKTIELLPVDLGISFSAQETFENLKKFGHRGNVLTQLKEQLFSLFFKQTKGFNFSLDQGKLEKIINENFAQFQDPPQNASIQFDDTNKKIYLLPSKNGQVLNKEEITEQILTQLPLFGLHQIDLRLIDKEPKVSTAQVQEAFSLGEKIINRAPFKINFEEKIWPIEASEIFSWFNFKQIKKTELDKIRQSIYKEEANNPSTNLEEENGEKIVWLYFNQEKIKEALALLAPSVNQSAINARLKASDKKTEISKASQPAVNLNITKSAQALIDALYQGQSKMELSVNTRPAKISEQTLEQLGLTDFLGSGYSDFTGSPFSRQHNIKTGTAKFDGVLIGPGEEFSFNTLLGDVDAANGYLPELVIKSNKTVPEYGGGLCQVSTTIFRAAINSGLEITERFHHAFPVRYYNPQGFDATIYPPHPDLRFKNDTLNNILFQARLEGTKLYFDIFGTADGREVKIKGPYIYESNEDGSLKAVLTQEIWRDNELDRKDVFYSNYKSPSLYPVEKNPLE